MSWPGATERLCILKVPIEAVPLKSRLLPAKKPPQTLNSARREADEPFRLLACCARCLKHSTSVALLASCPLGRHLAGYQAQKDCRDRSHLLMSYRSKAFCGVACQTRFRTIRWLEGGLGQRDDTNGLLRGWT
jgi:hypothetical protein